MATISIGVTSSTVVTGTRTYTISDPSLVKFIAWANTAYPSSSTSTRTDAQVLARWADQLIAGTRDAVTKREKDLASATASSNEPGIDIS